MKIYIVEDDPEIRELEQYALESGGFQAESFPSAAPFYTALSGCVPDLILLDIMLPGEDGLTILPEAPHPDGHPGCSHYSRHRQGLRAGHRKGPGSGRRRLSAQALWHYGAHQPG